MKSNFFDELELDNDGRRVHAGGPIRWKADPDRDEQVVEIKATISQNGVTARGKRNSLKRGQDPGWWCHADTDDNQQLEPGSAEAKGEIIIKTPSGLTTIDWDDEVQLKFPE
jgi:hypothetical protein